MVMTLKWVKGCIQVSLSVHGVLPRAQNLKIIEAKADGISA